MGSARGGLQHGDPQKQGGPGNGEWWARGAGLGSWEWAAIPRSTGIPGAEEPLGRGWQREKQGPRGVGWGPAPCRPTCPRRGREGVGPARARPRRVAARHGDGGGTGQATRRPRPAAAGPPAVGRKSRASGPGSGRGESAAGARRAALRAGGERGDPRLGRPRSPGAASGPPRPQKVRIYQLKLKVASLMFKEHMIH